MQKIKIPKSLLVFPIIFAVVLIALLIVLAVQLCTNVKILDYYIILVGLVASTGLLHTSLSCIKEYKKAVKEKIE